MEPTTSDRRRRRVAHDRDAMLDAIRRWVDEYGEPPMVADWEPSRARRIGQSWRAERFSGGDWPSARMVAREFPTFGAAVAAAGFRPRHARGWGLRGDGPEPIIAAIQEWAGRYGEPPTQADWDPVNARLTGQEWRAVRYDGDVWPSMSQVRNAFGNLGAALEAAGFVAHRRGDSKDQLRARRAANREAIARQSAEAPPSSITGDALAGVLRAVHRARVRGDDVALRSALLRLAGVALSAAECATADDV